MSPDGQEHLGTLSDYELEVVAATKAEAHLDACYEYMLAADGEHEGLDPATSPFCACHTCVVREVLRASWPIMRELARRDHARRA